MSEGIIKSPYQISIWEDKYDINSARYIENMLATIGSDTLDTPVRAFSPKFIENVNGTHTLSFSMFYRYYDSDTGEFLDNPYVKLLVNERSIKLKYKNEWYDFIIKLIEEDKTNYTFTYTAIDSYINELSKTGFNLEFSTELENNMGTISELGTKVLEGTDWQVSSADILRQTKIETLYEYSAVKDIDLGVVYKFSPPNFNMVNNLTIPAGEKIYVFYSSLEENGKDCHFYCFGDNEIITDSDNLILNGAEYYYTLREGQKLSSDWGSIISQYQGEKYVRKAETLYDPTVDKFVSVYKHSDTKYYSYTESEYYSSDIVKNYLVNSTDYINTSGWVVPNTSTAVVSTDINDNIEAILRINFPADDTISNTCFVDNRSAIGEITKKKYIVRIKTEDTFEASKYQMAVRKTDGSDNVLVFNNFVADGSTGYYKSEAVAAQSISYAYLSDYKFFIECLDANGGELILKDIQLFEELTNLDGNIIYPGDTPESGIFTKYYLYTPSKDYSSVDDIQYEYIGKEIPSDYILSVDDNCEKVRSIEIKESNRFNILQNLSETFECWADFYIEHNNDGSIAIDSNGNRKKYVRFVEEKGQRVYSGFKYGINLTNIARSIDSDQIVTKTIVKNNNNQFAQDGFCSIARASDNTAGENFILDFSYYINQGLLDREIINNDLYMTGTNIYIGYLTKLGQINKERDALANEFSAIGRTIDNLTAKVQTAETAISSAETNISNLKTDIYSAFGYTYENINNAPNSVKDATKDSVRQIGVLNKIISNQTAILNKLRPELQAAEDRRAEIEVVFDEKITQKEELDQQFYNKYSRYIQEGSWISEDYIDDTLYYLDALSIAHTSSMPQISYRISVTDVSALEEYAAYTFKCGDITYIEDVEFFGWQFVGPNAIPTPYKEEVIVSQIESDLDNPNNNVITVQNYKTQFEDLFQRITATTQALQFAEGSYNKVANVITETGQIKLENLQNSLIGNTIVLENSKDQSVTWDETGITTTSLGKPNEILRIVSGGLFVSKDGGQTWITGITANGINASLLTAGQIDVSKVRVMSGSFPAFAWDDTGIHAYEFDRTESGGTYDFNYRNFVRYDQFGLYGYKSASDEIFIPLSADDIWINENVPFQLTWKGFKLKGQNGAIEISDDNAIKIFDDTKERIVLGRFADGTYGLKVTNSTASGLNSTVLIGYDSDIDTAREQKYHQVINASSGDSSFIVYEDGYVKAKGSEFEQITVNKGTFTDIIAKGGQFDNITANDIKVTKGEFNSIKISGDSTIGGLTVDQITQSSQYFNIEENNNVTVVKIKDNVYTPSSLNFSIVSNDANLNKNDVSWEWTSDFEQWHNNSIGETYILDLNGLVNQPQNMIYIKAEGGGYVDYYTLTIVSDGVQGPQGRDGNTYSIECLSARDEFIYYQKMSGNEDYIYYFDSDISQVVLRLYINGKVIPYDEYKDNIEWINKKNNDDAGYITFNTEIPEEDTVKSDTLNIKLNTTENNASHFIENYYIVLIRIKYNENLYYYPISIRPAMNDELMKFSVHANSVVAAIDNKIISFSDTGLSISNKNEEVFSVSADSGSAYFKGEIVANSGTIGGISIQENGVIGEGFELSKGGAIFGAGVTIDPYLKIGNAYILNPAKYGRDWLISGGDIENEVNPSKAVVRIRDDGIAYFGNIKVDGKTSSIYSNDNSTDPSWYLKPNLVVFNNIVARGKIVTSVFEKGKTQVAGGSFVFKEASLIKALDMENLIISLEIEGIPVDSYLRIINNNNIEDGGALLKIVGSNGSQYNFAIINNSLSDDFILKDLICINLGQIDSNNIFEDNYIGINATATERGNLVPNAFSVSELQLVDKDLVHNNKVVLGQLPANLFGDLTNNSGSYGLYATNVYLEGMLISKDTNSCAGIYSQGINNGIENIVIWAGATDSTKTNIENAKFRVTREGTLYAQDAYIKGATISEAEIGTNLIFGYGDETPLTIKDGQYINLGKDNNGEVDSYLYIGADKNQSIANQITFLKPAVFAAGIELDWVEADGFSTKTTDNKKQSALYQDKLIFGNDLYTNINNATDSIIYIQGSITNNKPQLTITGKETTLNFDTMYYGENVRIVKQSEGYDIYVN